MRLLFIAFLACLLFPPAQASDTSEALFAAHRISVFQIRLVDSGSNEKKAIGSGFRVGPDGIVATNYHVISDSVYEKDHYRIEAVDDKNVTHRMTLRAIDIVHDLALLEFTPDDKVPVPRYPALAINTGDMLQGEYVFSLGNPHDIGMMIVAGEYNGPVKDSRYQRMIFSGNINGGMSGGPAINQHGEIVGINVASSGNGIGYLVPAKYLAQLLVDYPQQAQQKLSDVAGKQLLADQQDFYAPVVASSWPLQDFADLSVPKEIHSSIKCWGKSTDTKNRRYDSTSLSCSNSSDYLFILGGKYLGFIEYKYRWARQLKLNRFQLYSLAEDKNEFSSYSFDDDEESWTKDDVTPYTCKTSFLDAGGGKWRAVHCIRSYKIFPGLFDVGIILVSVDHNDKLFGLEMTATGISQENASQLTEKFIRSMVWK